MATITIGPGISLGAGISFEPVDRTYWLAKLTLTGNALLTGVARDSNNNIYVVGYTIPSSNANCLIAKYDTSGNLQWQQTWAGSANEYFNGITIDSSDNIYVTGWTATTGQTTTGGGEDFLIVKYDTSGNVQWQNVLGRNGADKSFSIAASSAGNVYVLGHVSTSTSGYEDMLVAKYNSSGTLEWQRRLGGSGQEFGYSIAVDSSENIFVVGSSSTSVPSSNTAGLIAKYNSSGTLQWQRYLSGTGAAWAEFYGVTLDSAGNVYATGFVRNAGVKNALIAKYNTSGTLQWQRTLADSTNATSGFKLAVDSSDNIYMIGYFTFGGDIVFMAKYNSSGAIQWQRTLTFTTNSIINNGGSAIAVSPSGTMYISATNAMAKLPGTGAGTNTYTADGTTYTYDASTFTDAAVSLTDVAAGLSSATTSLTAQASTFTPTTAGISTALAYAS
jgi:uncharacterized delta-60 repeat protein